MENREDRIKLRAHQLWENAGCPDGQHVDFWLAAEKELVNSHQANEGEGNRTAARQYNQDTQQFIKSGRVPAKAQEAMAALDGAEGQELRRAEAAGKSHSHGEDPEVLKRSHEPVGG